MKSLRLSHNCYLIGDLVKQVSQGEDPQQDPKKRDCPCINCMHLKSKGCRNPSACYKAAEKILASIPPKLDPYDSYDPPPYPLDNLCENLPSHTVNDAEAIKIIPKPEVNLYKNIRIFTPHNTEAPSPPPPCQGWGPFQCGRGW